MDLLDLPHALFAVVAVNQIHRYTTLLRVFAASKRNDRRLGTEGGADRYDSFSTLDNILHS